MTKELGDNFDLVVRSINEVAFLMTKELADYFELIVRHINEVAFLMSRNWVIILISF